MFASLILAFAVLAAPHGAEAEPKNGKTENGNGNGNDVPEVPGDDIFGFTSTTDTGNKGDLTFSNELNGFTGKRYGSYNVLNNKVELGYTPAEDWWISASAFVTNHRIHGVTEILDIDKTQFEGLSFEVQWRLIKRSASNPFALAIAVEPFRSWIDLATGQRADSYGAAFKILTDAVIVPDKVFWGANAIWEPVRSQDILDRSIWLSTSASELSTALTFQLSKSLFVGAEVRQLVAYDGTWFDQRLGYATYFGPTMLWKITDKIVFNATWQPQVSGRSADNPDFRYDLDNFERAQFRAKLTVELN